MLLNYEELNRCRCFMGVLQCCTRMSALWSSGAVKRLSSARLPSLHTYLLLVCLCASTKHLPVCVCACTFLPSCTSNSVGKELAECRSPTARA